MTSNKSRVYQLTLLMIIVSCIVSTNLCWGNTEDLYLLKEAIEVTTDWTFIEWDKDLKVIASTYKIIDGENAVQDISVSGMDVWVSKENYDTTKVVVEVEALVLIPDKNVNLLIEKGDIESTKILIRTYQPDDRYRYTLTLAASGHGSKEFNIDLENEFSYSPTQASIIDAIPDLKDKVYAFYYPWYGNPVGVSGESFHWEGVTNEDIHNSDNYPLLGPYDSHDQNIIRTHIKLAKQAGIDGFIVSWWGQNTFEDRAMDDILAVAMEEEFIVSVYYETVRDELTIQAMVNEISYIVEKYGDHENFLKENNEPVIFVYVPGYLGRNEEWWLSVREEVEGSLGPITLIGDHKNRDLLNAFEAFHSYIYLGDAPKTYFSEAQETMGLGVLGASSQEIIQAAKNSETITLYNKPFMVTVCPGFDSRDWNQNGLFVSRENGERYDRNWNAAIEQEAHTILLTSFNEWHEGTELEPSREYGFEYLNYTKTYVEEYKKIDIRDKFSRITVTLNPLIISNSENKGVITFNYEPRTPLLFTRIDISAIDGAKNPNIKGDYTTYYQEKDQQKHLIIIPIIDEDINLEVEFDVIEEKPEFKINIEAYDPSGHFYELFNGRLFTTTKIDHTDTLQNLEKRNQNLTEKLEEYSTTNSELQGEITNIETSFAQWKQYTYYGAAAAAFIVLIMIILLVIRKKPAPAPSL